MVHTEYNITIHAYMTNLLFINYTLAERHYKY